MQLNRIGNNETVVSFASGTEVLYSYDTPVAGRRWLGDGSGAMQVFKTDKKWSVTTSKHINKYLKTFNDEAVEIPQDEIEAHFAQIFVDVPTPS